MDTATMTIDEIQAAKKAKLAGMTRDELEQFIEKSSTYEAFNLLRISGLLPRHAFRLKEHSRPELDTIMRDAFGFERKFTKTREKSDRQLLKDAFASIRKEHKFIARMNFMCCSGCACAEIAEDAKKQSNKDRVAAVYWNKQDDESFNDEGNIKGLNELNIRFGALGELPEEEDRKATMEIGNILIKVFEQFGLETEWDGDPDTTISVLGQKLY